MDEINELKIKIFDLENEEKGLQLRYNQLEQIKSPFYQRLKELLTPKKVDEQPEPKDAQS
jgi:hypothetical protein